jgi:FkbM family methyltransferase
MTKFRTILTLYYSLKGRINFILEIENITRTFENLGDAILYFAGIKNKAKLKFRSGLTIDSNRETKWLVHVLYELYKSVPLKDAKKNCEYCWRVDWQNKILILPNGLRFYLCSVDPLIFSETYIHDIHFVGFDLKDKVIVDIGAFVGDTALYYANFGAIVYAYEPHPVNFCWLKKNIELNPYLKDRINIFNKAVGKDEEIEISIGGNINGGFSIYGQAKGKALKVKSVSLRKILEENNLNNPYLLKADCKGCEYYIIEDDAISKFEKVKIEYTGFNRPKVDYIISKLKSKGFSKFRIYKHNWLTYHLSDHGTIYAEK